MNVNEIPWRLAPQATHFTPEDENNHACFYQKSENGVWLKMWVCFDKEMDKFHEIGAPYVTEHNEKMMIERPHFKEAEETKTEGVEWDGKGLPPVGVEFEYSMASSGTWHYAICKYVFCNGKDIVAFCPHLEVEQILSTNDPFQPCKFRPYKKEPSFKEKMLDKWQRQALDFCEDTERSQYALGTVFDFIIKNFNVEEK